MKKNFLNLLALASILILNACSEDVTNPNDIESQIDDATAEAYTDFAEDDVNEMVIDLLDDLRFDEIRGAANSESKRFRPFAGRRSCAEIDLDITNGSLILDFGEGCESADGVTRSGKIIISFTDARHVAGAVIITTFENYMVNGNQVEGTRTLTNISNETEGQRAFEIKTENGKITFEDGTFRSFSGSKTKVWELEESTEEVTLTVTGGSSGTNREGDEFSKTITEPIIFKRSCRTAGVKVAVSGERTLVKSDDTYIINYGDGTCDNVVTVTLPNGEVEEITIERKRRG